MWISDITSSLSGSDGTPRGNLGNQRLEIEGQHAILFLIYMVFVWGGKRGWRDVVTKLVPRVYI